MKSAGFTEIIDESTEKFRARTKARSFPVIHMMTIK
jgi:hypothetical protein